MRINDKIRISPVMLINGNENLGVVSLDKAKSLALEMGLDLVEISPKSRPPVCKIIDYGKFKYEQSIKEKKKKGKSSHSKEIKLRPSIGEHDLNTKVNNIKRWLEEGSKVKVSLKYERRQLAHKDVGMVVMQKLLASIGDLATFQNPRFEGNFLNCMLDPK